MDWDVKKIRNAFGGKLVGSVLMKTLVCEAVLLLPSEIIEYVTRNVWFFSTSEDAWAYTFDGNDARNKHFIFLSGELLAEDKPQIQYTIIHEIGHVILKHKNSIGKMQTQTEIKIQEREADLFVRKYLK